MLPDELLSSLDGLISCREAQTRQLVTLLDSRFPNPSTLVIHGLHATGKSLTLGAALKSIDAPSAIVHSRECITTRHLLERAISDSKAALSKQHQLDLDRGFDGRCESISAFVVQLQLLLEGRGKFVLVFDGIDRQREALPTLLPAIARLGEIIPNLIVILVIAAPQARALQLAGVPHIHFPPYTRGESLSIVSCSPLPITDPPPNDDESESDSAHRATISETDTLWLWTRFCGAVWDSLGQAAARDIVSFRAVCSRLWKPFTQPVVQGDYRPREFSKLMVKNRALFQTEDPLKEPILSLQSTASTTPKPTRAPLPRFPHHTSHLLLAAYLASHTPPRADTLLYSKSSQHASRRRRRQHRQTLPAANAASSRRRKIPRHLLGPQPFPLERLFAIFHATSPSTPVAGGEIMAQVATLAGLSLLLRASSAAADDGGGGGGKWKVGFGWEFAVAVARGVEFDLEIYLGE